MSVFGAWYTLGWKNVGLSLPETKLPKKNFPARVCDVAVPGKGGLESSNVFAISSRRKPCVTQVLLRIASVDGHCTWLFALVGLTLHLMLLSREFLAL